MSRYAGQTRVHLGMSVKEGGVKQCQEGSQGMSVQDWGPESMNGVPRIIRRFWNKGALV